MDIIILRRFWYRWKDENDSFRTASFWWNTPQYRSIIRISLPLSWKAIFSTDRAAHAGVLAWSALPPVPREQLLTSTTRSMVPVSRQNKRIRFPWTWTWSGLIMHLFCREWCRWKAHCVSFLTTPLSSGKYNSASCTLLQKKNSFILPTDL